ncbi:hypothetical protein COCOBI_04-4570 [Coccomyxa sp. Obi]|nr:hypothetical protein COCOBI_04-4570 [Coccomyxa sp. Obi]
MAALSQASLIGAFPKHVWGQPLGSKTGCRRIERCRLRAVAEAEEEKVGLSFSANRNAARGYTEEDSAGQSNIFAVEPKQYVAGSSRDTGENSNNAALLAGAVGVGILAVGLLALRGTQPNTAVAVQQLQKEAANYRSLSSYKEQFASAAPATSDFLS